MKNKTELSIVNLSSYTAPEIKEKAGREWVEFGSNNGYFQYLIDRFNGSPTNRAIITGISEMIFGKGLDATDSHRRPEQYAQMISLFQDKVVRRLASDLKLMGQCAIQVIYSKNRSKIVKLEHIPVETLRAERCNEKGEIPAYYYCNDWAKYKRSMELKRIPAFGMSKEGLEILYVKPYRAGYKYYSPPDYTTQYAELEEEISNYHLNNILNGLAPSMLINMNNGTPDPEQRELIEQRIYQKFSGSSNAGKFILAFNDDPSAAATIDPIQLSEAHQQYQFLSEESSKKIMVGHRVVSPMLFGIKDSTGLGNNADELKTASILFDNMVIKGFQTLLINAFDEILAYNDISLHLYFKTLQPLEFTDLSNVTDEETREEETGVKLSEDKEQDKFNNTEDADSLIGLGENEEDLLKDYELIDEHEVDYDLEDELDENIKQLNEEVKLTSTGRANKSKVSKQDGKTKSSKELGYTYLVRYMYTKAPGKADSSRKFCKDMMRAKKVYRKEDILAMGQIAVNPGFGKGGASKYSIWLYKGGPRCFHRWTRKIYLRKDGGSFGDAKRISTRQAGKQGFKPESNDNKVSIAPRNMTYEGYTAAYWKKKGFTYSNK